MKPIAESSNFQHDPRDVALAWADWAADMKRCHDCFACFPQAGFAKSPEAQLIDEVFPQLRISAAGQHSDRCRGKCRVPECETHGSSIMS